jgi:DNA-binding CsgD family transcriptional regulator
MTSLRDKQIFIVGPLKAQNRLMCSFLELETGVRCMNVKDFHGIQLAGDAEGGHQSLALWDCFGRDLKGFLSEFSADVDGLLPRHYVALFNVVPGLGIEEEAVDRGVRGVFYLEEGLERLKQGVHAILNGELWVPKTRTDSITQNGALDQFTECTHHFLTSREVDILKMLTKGYSNSKIAEAFCINLQTVKSHLYNAYKKINVPSRLQAALWSEKHL